jgi:hypothetical protein
MRICFKKAMRPIPLLGVVFFISKFALYGRHAAELHYRSRKTFDGMRGAAKTFECKIMVFFLYLGSFMGAIHAVQTSQSYAEAVR